MPAINPAPETRNIVGPELLKLLFTGSAKKPINKKGLKELIAKGISMRPKSAKPAAEIASEVTAKLIDRVKEDDLIPVPEVILQCVTSSTLKSAEHLTNAVMSTLYKFVVDRDQESREIVLLYESLHDHTSHFRHGWSPSLAANISLKFGVQLCRLLKSNRIWPGVVTTSELRDRILKHYFPKPVYSVFRRRSRGTQELPLSLSALVSAIRSQETSTNAALKRYTGNADRLESRPATSKYLGLLGGGQE